MEFDSRPGLKFLLQKVRKHILEWVVVVAAAVVAVAAFADVVVVAVTWHGCCFSCCLCCLARDIFVEIANCH